LTQNNQPVKPILLEVKEITKVFGGTVALNDVSLGFQKGEIHALCGENGAGKSTLGKIIGGVFQPDRGSIFYDGKKVVIRNPNHALDLGISEMYQETYLIPDISIAENIFIKDKPTLKRTLFIDWKRMFAEAQEYINTLNINIDVKKIMKTLSTAEVEMVSLARALRNKSKLILMDEPTASLSYGEIEKLFKVMRQLQQQEVTIIFITHKLEEVITIANRVSVLRDGCLVHTDLVKNVDEEKLTAMMIGKTTKKVFPLRSLEKSDVIFEVKNLGKKNEFSRLSFQLHQGEIIGIGGLVGSGKEKIARTIIEGNQDEGEIFIKGDNITLHSPNEARHYNIGYVPADRHLYGLIKLLSIRENTFLSTPLLQHGFIHVKKERELVSNYINMLNIKTWGESQLVRDLSGGNQQKVLLARLLASSGEIFILEEPTRGVDVGAKSEIYQIIQNFSLQGKSILIISSETNELLLLCHKILMMREGQVEGVFDHENVSEDLIIETALGVRINHESGEPITHG
jgi:ABC-type sugar transport system ATPase subunit